MKKNDNKKEIITFGLASFFNDVGSDTVAPIWPTFVVDVLHADMKALGLLDGLGVALVSISNAISGWLSDKIKKRKLFIYLGYLLSGISRIGYSISPSWHYLIPFKAVDRVGKIRGAPKDAYITEITKKNTRGRSFGILRSMDAGGALVGTALSLLLIKYLSIRTIIFLAAIPSLLSALLIFLFIKERKVEVKYVPIRLIKFNKRLKLMFIVGSLFAFANLSYSFLIVSAKSIGLNNENTIILYLLFNIIHTIFSYQFGKLSDKIGRKNVLYISFTFFIFVTIGFTMVKSLLGLILLFILYGLFNAAWNPVKRAFIAELSPKNARATAIGLYQLVTGLIALPSGFIMGLLWEVNRTLPFSVAAVITVISMAILRYV